MTSATHLPRDLPLRLLDEGRIELGELAHHGMLAIQLLRCFGCLFRQEWLLALDDASDELEEQDARALAAGCAADYPARWLLDTRGVSMPLLLDPEHLVQDAVGAAAPLGVRLADPRGLAASGRAVLRGGCPQRITADTIRSPGVIILDSHLAVRWVHGGRRIGDYPPLQVTLDAIAPLRAPLPP